MLAISQKIVKIKPSLAISMYLSRGFIVSPLIACFCVGSIILLQIPRLQKLVASSNNVSVESLERDLKSEKIQLNLLKVIPSFSYDNAIADWVFIDFLQYFGDDPARDRTGYSLSPDFFDVIVERDPRFLEAYRYLSTSTAFYAAMPEKSIALMDKGFPFLRAKVPKNAYYAWRDRGIDELLFLGNAKAAEKSFTQAANWANEYSDPQSKYVADISQKTANFLATNPDSKLARISTWTTVLEMPVDQKTRLRVIQKITDLGGQVVLNPDGTYKVKLPKKD